MNKTIKYMSNRGIKNKNSNKKTKKKKIQKKIMNRPNIKDDAFTYFNYSWINNTKIPKTKTKTNLYSILQENIDRYLIKMIESFEKSKKEEEINCWNLYYSYLKRDNSLIKHHIKNEYNHLCSILGCNDIMKLYIFFTFKNISLPFVWSVDQDSRNVSHYENHLYDNGLTLIDKDYYILNEHNDKLNEYKKYIKNMFDYIFGKNHKFDINSIIDVEKEFAKYTPDEWERQNSDKNYNKVSSDELTEMGFNWKTYSHEIGFKKTPNFIILNNKRYFERMFNFINKNWNTDKMRSYWIFKLIKSFSGLENKLKEMSFNFFDYYLHDQKSQISDKNAAMKIVTESMNTYISNKFLKENCDKKNRDYIERLSQEILVTFKNRINKNNWLSNKTKDYAIKKINNTRIFVGHKDRFLKDSNIQYTKEDIYLNLIGNINCEIKDMIYLYSIKYDKFSWNRYETGNVYDVNAFYNPLNNEIILPCGILRYPFVQTKYNFEYVLAFLGTTIAHELIHGFDDDGSKYDMNGNYVTWWSKKDKEKYLQKQNSIIKLYNKILKKDGYDIDSKLSLGENLADNGGLSICEDLLTEKIKNKKEKERDYIIKNFYKYYCYQWKDKMKKQAKLEQMKTDEHLFSKFRCNGTLMNSELFIKTFDINKEDNMFNEKPTYIW